MSNTNGMLLSRHRTSSLSRLRNGCSVMWTLLQSWPPPVRLLSVLVLLVFSALTMGCATPLTSPSVLPRNPSKPLPVYEQPTEPYLIRVERNIKLWEKQLRDTLVTP